MSERWGGVPSSGRRDGWGPPSATEPPLRRHSQPRHVDDERSAPSPSGPSPSGEYGSYRVPTRRNPDPSSFDPDLTAVADVVEEGRRPRRERGFERGLDRAPDDGYDDYDEYEDDYPPGGGRGRDLGLNALRRNHLQPGVRLRIGPRHGAGNRPDEHAPKGPARAALGAGSEVAVVLGMALLLSLLIKTFLVQAFYIPSTSMEQTLLVGDRVLVSKLTPGVFQLHRGDVVVFSDPGGWLTAEEAAPAQSQTGGVAGTVKNALSFVGLLPQDAGEHLIKRVIGVGGDHVVCCDAQKRIEVNGLAVDETPYLFPGADPSDTPFDVTVPYGYLWVMGDNRRVSADSRLHRSLNNGMVPVHDVVGKAFVKVWPLDRFGGLGVPDTVFARVPNPPH